MESLPDPNPGEEKKELPGKDPEGRMTFTEHLGELRTRLVRSGLAIAIGFVICYWQADNIISLLMKPLTDPGMLDWVEVVTERISEEFSNGEEGRGAPDDETTGEPATPEGEEEPAAGERKK